MTMPARTELTKALFLALGGITKDRGYWHDIGNRVTVGSTRLSEDNTPCCILYPGNETPIRPGLHGLDNVQVTYRISGYVNRLDTAIEAFNFDPSAEWMLVDTLIEDIRKAVEGSSGCGLDTSLFHIIEYQGAQVFYSTDETGNELCGVTLTFLIQTPWVDTMPGNS